MKWANWHMKAQLARYSGLLLIGAVIIGAVLRWLQIGTHSFWYDEALSSLIAGLSLVQILNNVAASDHPPGYYILLHFWLQLGQSEATIRSLSAVFSLATIPLVYGLGRWLFDRTTAALTALGMALFPFQIYFAQETRMYGLVVFLATALTWSFLYAVRANGAWWAWLVYAVVAVGGLYVHYFFAFLLLGFHIWLILDQQRFRAVVGRLALADILIVVLFGPQLGQALSRTGAYLGGVAWQASPHLLSPLTTIYYLLFVHRSPTWVFPIGIFLTLTALILNLWECRRQPQEDRRIKLVLWLSIFTPIVAVVAISWLILPIYLERSFAIASPALVLLLARGAVAAPHRSPTPFLTTLLLVPIIVTLGVSMSTPDPAKPPVREATRLVARDFGQGDVSLHLQDASFMPAAWYAPRVPHVLADVPGAAWTVAPTHRLFGGDVVDWQAAVVDADRLWLTVMPGFTGPEQVEVLEKLEATYPRLKMEDWGAVQLYLYNLHGDR
jgi:uncharacterized membrane protein